MFLFNTDNDVVNVNSSSISGSHYHHCKYMLQYFFFSPICFLWGRHVDLGKADWRLVRDRLLIPCFLVEKIVNGRSKN